MLKNKFVVFKTEASCDPQFDGTAKCKASWDTPYPERPPTQRGGDSLIFFSFPLNFDKIPVILLTFLLSKPDRCSLYWLFSTSPGGAAAAALHDQVRLRGSRCLSESAAGAAEHQGVETQSKKSFPSELRQNGSFTPSWTISLHLIWTVKQMYKMICNPDFWRGNFVSDCFAKHKDVSQLSWLWC